jgi:hypothetical protein
MGADFRVRKYDDEKTIYPAATTPIHERRRVALDDRARHAVALEIIRAHKPEQLAQILTWCDSDMCALIALLQARHGRKVSQ